MTATSTKFYILGCNSWVKESGSSMVVSLEDGYNDETKSDMYWINDIPPMRTPQVGESMWSLTSYSTYRELYIYVTSSSNNQGYTVKEIIDENTLKLNNDDVYVRKYPIVKGNKKYILFSANFPTAFDKAPNISIVWKNPYNEVLPPPKNVNITTSATGHSGATFTTYINDLHDVYDRFEYKAYVLNV